MIIKSVFKRMLYKMLMVTALLGILLAMGYSYVIPVANTWAINLELAAVGGQGQVNLSWTTTAMNIDKYRIHRSTNQGFTPTNETLLKLVGGNSTVYPDTEVEGRKTYYYRIEAVDEDGIISSPSNETSAQADVIIPHGQYLSNNLYTCKFCHDNHDAVNKPLVKKNVEKELCYSCHSEVGQSLYKTDQDFAKTGSVHPVEAPSAAGNQLVCSKCHNPHGNINSATGQYFAKYLRSKDPSGDFFYEGNPYCWSCHGSDSTLPSPNGDKESWYPGSTVNAQNPNEAGTGHDLAVMKPSSDTKITCSRCHESHGSSIGKLIRTEIKYSYNGTDIVTTNVTGNNKTFCYACHEGIRTDITREDYAWDGKAVSEKTVLTADGSRSNGHNADCNTCHDPHGTANKRYLLKTYDINASSTRTKTFDSGDFQACFTCHDEAAFSGSETGFRNGTVNLHIKHLNELGSKGNAVCKECHRPHGAVTGENPSQQHRVGFPASTVTPSGTNTKPLFNNLETGGSCSLTCHGTDHDGGATYTYTR